MLLNINSEDFSFYFPSDTHNFISENFMSLNAWKVDKIVRLVQNNEKITMGLIAGIKNNILLSPFSAPFGGFHFKNDNIYAGAIESFIKDMITYSVNESIEMIKITLPPDIYCQSFNAKVINVLMRNGFQIKLSEITNWVDLNQFNGLYTHNASRTYYNQSLKNKLEFHKTASIIEMKAIYDLIVENRVRMGRPIYMTFEDIQETAKIFQTHFFKVIDSEGNIVASAIFYCAHPNIAYAVFWGDSLAGRPLRAMDFLIFQLYNFYKLAGIRFIDLGTSTESGIPNEGLLRFKETHECISSSKFTFTISTN